MKQTRILLIEDEVSVVETIQLMLDEHCNKKECFIDSALNFLQAMDYLDTNDYNIIVTDLQMPGKGLEDHRNHVNGTILNGWTFLYFYILEEGKYANRCKNTKIIIFSEFLDELDKRFKAYPNELSQSFKDRVIRVSKGGMHSGEGGTVKLCRMIEGLIKNE